MWSPLLPTAVLTLLTTLAQAQLSAKCSPTLVAARPLPSVAAGYVVRLVANGLTLPRSIKFDNNGHLIVVESGKGVTALTLKDSGGGCIQETKNLRKTVVSKTTLNHGLEISDDGTQLFASDPDKVYRWRYDGASQSVSGPVGVLVDGMEDPAHNTRTLLLSKFAPGQLLVNHGSTDDIDPTARRLGSGSAQIRSFDVTNNANFPYDYKTSGTVMGWGLRNDVGMREVPGDGGLYSVENGANLVTRNGKSIYNDNPAEEMNFLGYVSGTPSSPNRGSNFGYPDCYTTFATNIPAFSGRPGTVIGFNSSDDRMCQTMHTPPRIIFESHSAPIDLLFNDAGTTGWVTFRGSDKVTPSRGYGLAQVQFSGGKPVQTVHSTTAAKYIAQSKNLGSCTKQNCWAPVSLAFDGKGRLFMSSDYTGEIYVLLRSDGSGVNN